jgi:hypothetical protein
MDEETRAAFLDDFVAAVGQLAKKYGARSGEPFRVSLAAYPVVEAE